MNGGIVGFPQSILDPDRVYPYLVFALAGLAGHTAFALAPENPVLSGAVIDTDGYMHMIRARELYETSAWYDNVIERVNAPYGLALHWTRIFDVILLALALPLTLILDFPNALHSAALALGPLVHVAAACAVAWMARPLIPDVHRLWVLPVFFLQGTMLSYSLAGRVDHHGLLVLMAALSLGAMLRLLKRPENWATALWCGAAHGVGLWLSPEFILIVLLDLATVGVLWGIRGGPWNRSGLRLCLGALLAVVVYLPVEYPPGELYSIEHDRISAFHAFFLALSAGVWGLSRWRSVAATPTGRWIFLIGCAIAGFGILSLLFPEFHRGPMAGIDPRMYDLLIAKVAEMGSPLGADLEGLGRPLWVLGGAIIAVPFGVWIVLHDRGEKNYFLWLFLFACFAILLVLGLLHARLSSYAEVPLAIFVAEFLRRASRALGGRVRETIRIVILAYLALFVSVGPLVASNHVRKARSDASAAGWPTKRCDNQEILDALDWLERSVSMRPSILLTDSMASGPMIVYFTSHAVVSAPYHRNVRGVLDADQIWNGEHNAKAQAIISERGIDFLVLCIALTSSTLDDPIQHPNTLYARLKEGQDIPEWLVPMVLPVEFEQSHVRIYRVLD